MGSERGEGVIFKYFVLSLVQATYAVEFMHFVPKCDFQLYFTCSSSKFGYLVSMSTAAQKQQLVSGWEWGGGRTRIVIKSTNSGVKL